MKTRFERIASRMVQGMTDFEKESWEDQLHLFVGELDTLADEMDETDLGGIGGVERGVAKLRRDQKNLDNPVLDREVDELTGEVMRLLNEAEGESRRHEDEAKRYEGKCKEMGAKARDLMARFKNLEGRI